MAPSTLSRIETGKAPTKSVYLNAMLETYGVADADQRQVLVDMAREGHRKGWWSVYDDVLPSGFGIYVGLEAEAAGLRASRSKSCTGCCRRRTTRARCYGDVHRDTAEQIDRLVDLRIKRQDGWSGIFRWTVGDPGRGGDPPDHRRAPRSCALSSSGCRGERAGCDAPDPAVRAAPTPG